MKILNFVKAFCCFVFIISFREVKERELLADGKDFAGKEIFISQDASFVLDTIVSNLVIPFGFDWISDSVAVFTERGKESESITLLNVYTGKMDHLCNLPKVYSINDNGMMDVLVHPDFKNNGWLYFSYCTMLPDSTSTLIIERAKIKNNCLIERQKIFEVLPYLKSQNNHFGTRMKIINGYLFISMGDRYIVRDSAQTLTNDLGKILRLHDDGSIPADNPFVHTKGARPEIWSYGHRNPQGMAINPSSNELWINEHGPKGGDEINIVKKGHNYGWPVICYGINYDNTIVGAGITHKQGMDQPVFYYRPSIAPSGMDFYTGNKFPKWDGNIFIGALALTHLNRLTIEGDRVIHEERLLGNQNWRVRLVKQGFDGYLYIGVDSGMIVRLRPL